MQLGKGQAKQEIDGWMVAVYVEDNTGQNKKLKIDEDVFHFKWSKTVR